MLVAAVNFVSSWSSIWSAISGAVGSQLTTALSIIGGLLVLMSVLKWLWDRRKGGFQGNHHNLLWTLIIGAVLVSPNTIIPVLLTVVDLVINLIVGIVSHL